MIHNYRGVEDSAAYSALVQKLRKFFLSKGFIEIHTQDRLSILAACEDPSTVATYEYSGEIWPLPQTGQMWLEYELLTHQDRKGVFCVSTSYRAEKNPVSGRHKLIFPMFEFESWGTMDDLRNLEQELLEYLGFGSQATFIHETYDALASHYQVEELSYKEENAMEHDFGNVVFLEKFPIRTSPFWNMKKDGEYAHKIDVIIAGNETIGSAERSSDTATMRQQFETISDGGYAKKLYDLFGKDRVTRELDEFLTLDFRARFGGGIGITRLIDAMKKTGIPFSAE
jgi:aspartyl/asparaginyl-tRNA synthetase